MKKQYKALMLDLDGTTIPNDLHGRPSEKVKHAIAKAREKIHIGIATSRPYFHLNGLQHELQLSGPSIIQSGARIIDFTTGKIYSEHQISKEDILAIYQIANKLNLPLLVDGENEAEPATEDNIAFPRLGAVVFGIKDEKKADAFCESLADIPTIVAHKITSWTKGTYDVSISHSEATKQHGVYEVAKILGVETHEIIGVGDGYNDFPLLMACGFKVAMGNAVEDLKAIADYVAPTVEEDGVVNVIEKFILHTRV